MEGDSSPAAAGSSVPDPHYDVCDRRTPLIKHERENSPRSREPPIYIRLGAISTKNWDTQSNLRVGVMPETVEVAELLHELLSAVISPVH